jgi:hypothetical protein
LRITPDVRARFPNSTSSATPLGLRSRGAGATAWALVLGGWGLLACALAQLSGPAVAKGPFTFPEYDKRQKLRSLLTGTGARQQPGGRILMDRLQLLTYTDDGRTNLLIIGTNCWFDANARVASSAEALQVRSGDGRLFIEGVGFLWRQTNSHLIISNRVHTRLLGVEAAPRKTTL